MGQNIKLSFIYLPMHMCLVASEAKWLCCILMVTQVIVG